MVIPIPIKESNVLTIIPYLLIKNNQIINQELQVIDAAILFL